MDKCNTKHNPMARVNAICIPPPPWASQVTVGIHLVQTPEEPKKYAKLGPANRRGFEYVWCDMLKNLTHLIQKKSLKFCECLEDHVLTKGF
jgi:hypothetical protein